MLRISLSDQAFSFVDTDSDHRASKLIRPCSSLEKLALGEAVKMMYMLIMSIK